MPATNSRQLVSCQAYWRKLTHLGGCW